MSTLKVTQGVDVDLLTDTVTDGTLGTGRVGPVKVAFGSATNITLVDSTHGLPVVGQGSAGTASGGVVTVQGVTSMTPVQVSQATAASLNATVVQGTAANLNAAVVGVGTAGASSGGVLSIQGVGSGTAVPISGAVTGSGTFAATQSGTWTVQPGNTANTTAWKVDGSAVTQPISGTVTVSGSLKELLTNNNSITITLTSLANNGYQQSTAIDNTSNLYIDAAVMVKIKTNGSGTLATGNVYVFAYGSADGGTTYTDGASGSNGSFTATVPTNLKLIGSISAVANATTYIGGPFSVASGFGYLPGKWGIVVQNATGATLDASIGSAFFESILYQKG